MKQNYIFILLLIILIGAGIWYFSDKEGGETELPYLINKIEYICKDDKTIEASYFEGELIPVEPGEMLTPAGQVKVVLSDGRELELPQTISASGVRYANDDESIIFWSKGNGAFLLENDEETYSGCIVLPTDPEGLPNVYLDNDTGFVVRYPADYRVDAAYKYTALGPEKEINGVKFIVSPDFTEGTNLSSADTGVSIETISEIENCNAGLFLGENAEIQEKEENGNIYSFASSAEAAVGNRYEEQVWAIPTIHSCIGVRYFIHYMAIENYPEEEVREFDKDVLIEQFDKIRYSLITQ